MYLFCLTENAFVQTMRHWIRKCEPARFSYWKCRQLCGLAPKSDHELLYRFDRHTERSGWDAPGIFCFPWGAFEYSAAGKVRIQYEEIFQKRHYAFKADGANPVIVDCGGNVGLSAVWFKLNYPSCRLSVFEPDRNLACMIDKNLQAAGFTGTKCIPKAVWVKDGAIGFDLRGDDSGKIDANATRMVETVDLAAWLPAVTDLLKIDIEGAEFDVLEHLCTTGAIQRVRNLVCELHVMRGTESKMAALMQQLIAAGMRLSLNYGAVTSGIGVAGEEAPFEVIARNHLLIELYAWR